MNDHKAIWLVREERKCRWPPGAPVAGVGLWPGSPAWREAALWPRPQNGETRVAALTFVASALWEHMGFPDDTVANCSRFTKGSTSPMLIVSF